MTQYSRPTSNTTQTNFTGGYAEIDEVTASDSDYAYSPNALDGVLICTLGALANPGSGQTFTIKWRHAKLDTDEAGGPIPDGGGGTVSYHLWVRSGTTDLLDLTGSGIGAWTESSHTFSSSSVTDWNNFTFELQTTGAGGAPANRRGFGVSWFEISGPDATTTHFGICAIAGDGAATATATATLYSSASPSATASQTSSATATLYSSASIAASSTVPSVTATVIYPTSATFGVVLANKMSSWRVRELQATSGANSGTWYTFAAMTFATTRDRLSAFKCSSPAGDKTRVASDVSMSYTDGIIAAASTLDPGGRYIHVAYIESTASSRTGLVRYVRFDTNDETFGTPVTVYGPQVLSLDTGSALSAQGVAVAIACDDLGSGDMVITHPALAVTGFDACRYAYYDASTPQWNNGNTLSSSAAEDRWNGGISESVAGKVLLGFTKQLTRKTGYRQLTFGGTVGTLASETYSTTNVGISTASRVSVPIRGGAGLWLASTNTTGFNLGEHFGVHLATYSTDESNRSSGDFNVAYCSASSDDTRTVGLAVLRYDGADYFVYQDAVNGLKYIATKDYGVTWEDPVLISATTTLNPLDITVDNGTAYLLVDNGSALTTMALDLIHYAAATVSTSASMTATGAPIREGSAALSCTASVTATGERYIAGSASVAASASVTSSGTATLFDTSSVSCAATVPAVTVSIVAIGSSSVAASATSSASGVVQSFRTASVVSAASVSATASVSGSASASITATATAGASAFATLYGLSTANNAVAGASASGVVESFRSATPSALAGVTSTANLGHFATGSSAATASITAAAVVTGGGPTTLNSVWATARGGPMWINSAWYKFDLDPSDRTKLRANKSTTTANDTYSATVSLTPPTMALTQDEIIGYDTIRGWSGTLIHCAIAVGSTAQNCSIYYAAYDSSTDTWGTPELLTDNVTYTASASAAKVVGIALSISVNTIGDVLVVSNGLLATGSVRQVTSVYDASAATWTKNVLTTTYHMVAAGCGARHGNGTGYVPASRNATSNRERVSYRQLTTADPPTIPNSELITGETNQDQVYCASGIRDYNREANERFAQVFTYDTPSPAIGIRTTSYSIKDTSGLHQPKKSITNDIWPTQCAACSNPGTNTVFIVFQHTSNTGLWFTTGSTAANGTLTKFARLSADTTIIPKDLYFDPATSQIHLLYDAGGSYEVMTFELPAFVQTTSAVASSAIVTVNAGSIGISATCAVASSASVSITGISAITCAATGTATATVNSFNTATVSAAGLVAATGSVAGESSASIAALGGLASSAFVESFRTASSSASAAVACDGIVQSFRTASVAAIGSSSASGVVQSFRTASATALASVAATGDVQSFATATIASSASATATALVESFRSASVVSAATATGTATGTLFATATVAADAFAVATGAIAGQSSCDITAAASVTSSAIVNRIATASVTCAASSVATASIETFATGSASAVAGAIATGIVESFRSASVAAAASVTSTGDVSGSASCAIVATASATATAIAQLFATVASDAAAVVNATAVEDPGSATFGSAIPQKFTTMAGGPFRPTAGANAGLHFAIATIDGGTINRQYLGAFRSSDGLATWTEQDSANRPDGDADPAVTLSDGIACYDARLKSDGKTIRVAFAAVVNQSQTVYEVSFDTDTLTWSTPTVRSSNKTITTDTSASLAVQGLAIGMALDDLSGDEAIFYQGQYTTTNNVATLHYSYYDQSLDTWTDNLVLYSVDIATRNRDMYGITETSGGVVRALSGSTNQPRTVSNHQFTFGGTTGTVGAVNGDGYIGETTAEGCRHVRGCSDDYLIATGSAVTGSNGWRLWCEGQTDQQIIGNANGANYSAYGPGVLADTYLFDKTDIVQVQVGTTLMGFFQSQGTGNTTGIVRVQTSQNGSGEYFDNSFSLEYLSADSASFVMDAVYDPLAGQVNLLLSDGASFYTMTWTAPTASVSATSSATATGKVGTVANVYAGSSIAVTLPGIVADPVAITCTASFWTASVHEGTCAISALCEVGATRDANTYTLDVKSDAYCGYGLRKMKSTATLSVKVRRASDNATADIGFVGDDLDTATMLTHCAGTDGFIEMYYDQSGNSAHLTAAVDGEEPQIVSSGALILDEAGYRTVIWNNSKMTGTAATSISNDNVHFHWYGNTLDPKRDSDKGAVEYPLLQVGTDLTYAQLSVIGHFHDTGPQSGTDSVNHHHGRYPFVRSFTTKALDRKSRLRIWTNIHFVRGRDNPSFSIKSSNQIVIGSTTGLNYQMSEFVITPAMRECDRRFVYNSMARNYAQCPVTYERGGGDSRYALPQKYGWQVAIRNWMRTLEEVDYELPVQRPTWDGTYRTVDELAYLYNWWYDERTTFTGAQSHAILNEPKRWVLNNGVDAGLEYNIAEFADNGTAEFDWIRLQHNTESGRDNTYCTSMAFMYENRLPLAGGGNGNPYYKQRGLAYRIAATAACKGMIDDVGEDASFNYFNDWTVGGHAQGWMPAYYKIRDALPAEAQQAFDDMVRWKVFRMWAHGEAAYLLGNLVCKFMPFITWAWRLFNDLGDEQYKTYCIEATKEILFGSKTGTPTTSDYRNANGIYCTWGGIVENGNTPDTTYNGRSLAEFARAAACTHAYPEWDFLKECDERMASWKLTQYFSDETDWVVGPSGYATRTGDGVNNDQDTSHNRNLVHASWYSWWHPLGRASSFVSEATMASRMSTNFTSGAWDDYLSQYTLEPVRYRVDLDSHWPTVEYPALASTYYSDLKWLRETQQPTSLRPYDKKHPGFNIDHGNVHDFWSYKATADNGKQFGWMIESYLDPGGSNGWWGGCLEAFWVEDYGVPFISRHNGAGSNYEDGDKENTRYWPHCRMWATSGIYGVGPTTNSTFFCNSSVDRDSDNPVNRRIVTYNLGAAEPTISVATRWGIGFDTSTGGNENATTPVLQGDHRTTAQWIAKRNGVQCITTHEMLSGTDTASEMWTRLPVYLGDPDVHDTDAIAEYWDGSAWQTLTTTLVETAEIRVRQYHGGDYRHCYVSFVNNAGGVARVRYCPEIFVQEYQGNDRMRNIEIDMLGGTPGTNQPIPASSSITYDITLVPMAVPTVAISARADQSSAASGNYNINDTSLVLADSHTWCVATVTLPGGGSYVYGSAAIVSAGSLAASGDVPVGNSCDIATTSAVSATGLLEALAASSITCSAIVSASSSSTITAAASVLSSAAVSSSAVVTVNGAADLQSQSVLTATGGIEGITDAQLSSVADVSASGDVTVVASAVITGACVVVASYMQPQTTIRINKITQFTMNRGCAVTLDSRTSFTINRTV